MRIWRIIAVSLFLAILIGTTACNPFGGASQEPEQPVEVARGDLTVKVNGSGKTSVATDAKLTFGTGGKIEKLYVKKGDTVKKGAALAKLETNDLELALLQAKSAQAQAELAQSQAEAARGQAESALETARLNLDKIKEVSDIKDDINDIQWRITIAEERQKESFALNDFIGSNYWMQVIRQARVDLLNKQKELADLLSKPGYVGVITYDVITQKYNSLVVQDVRAKDAQVKATEQSLEQAKKSVEYARTSVDYARKSVENAQKQLDNATLVATLDGVVATLDAKEGDVVLAPYLGARTLIYLIDPNSMEIDADIDEIDIPMVKLNQKVIISMDALPSARFEGKVTAISLVPSPQASGVVAYEVKIGFVGPPAPEFKVGMTTDVDIVVSERKNVLLLASRAVKHDAQERPYVEIRVNEQIKRLPVEVGLSDGINTEILNGLKEGDTVIIRRTTEQSSGLLQ